MAEPTKVEVRLGYTVNTGDFESLRVDVGIVDFVRESDGNATKAFDRVYGFMERQLLDKVTEARSNFLAERDASRKKG